MTAPFRLLFSYLSFFIKIPQLSKGGTVNWKISHSLTYTRIQTANIVFDFLWIFKEGLRVYSRWTDWSTVLELI